MRPLDSARNDGAPDRRRDQELGPFGPYPGLRGKYDVRKVATGEQVEACFVLRYDRDPHARAALLAYAESCEAENPLLAADLRRMVPDAAA